MLHRIFPRRCSSRDRIPRYLSHTYLKKQKKIYITNIIFERTFQHRHPCFPPRQKCLGGFLLLFTQNYLGITFILQCTVFTVKNSNNWHVVTKLLIPLNGFWGKTFLMWAWKRWVNWGHIDQNRIKNDIIIFASKWYCLTKWREDKGVGERALAFCWYHKYNAISYIYDW